MKNNKFQILYAKPDVKEPSITYASDYKTACKTASNLRRIGNNVTVLKRMANGSVCVVCHEEAK